MMQKTKIIPILLSIFIFTTCEKPAFDERDKVIGNYSGILVINYWVDTTLGFVHDTYPVIFVLSKSDLDSVVSLNFNEIKVSNTHLFYYSGGIFKSLQTYHPPQLVLKQDSLYFFYKEGLGPYWKECFTKKI